MYAFLPQWGYYRSKWEILYVVDEGVKVTPRDDNGAGGVKPAPIPTLEINTHTRTHTHRVLKNHTHTRTHRVLRVLFRYKWRLKIKTHIKPIFKYHNKKNEFNFEVVI